MKYKMFQRHFAPLIISGVKTTTIRPKSKCPLQPGEIISARYWEGTAYRSRQIEFCQLRVLEVGTAQLRRVNGALAVYINEIKLEPGELPGFAVKEGFNGFQGFCNFFADHDFPFDGDFFRFEKAKHFTSVCPRCGKGATEYQDLAGKHAKCGSCQWEAGSL